MPKKSSAPTRPAAPGAFRFDGSFNAAGGLRDRGHVDGLARALIAQRRRGELSLVLAHRAIVAAEAQAAFPNAHQWERCSDWALAWASTSAEEAVKREGRGVNGHWCGERWIEGHEHECADQRHRVRPDAEAVRKLLRTLGNGLGWA